MSLLIREGRSIRRNDQRLICAAYDVTYCAVLQHSLETPLGTRNAVKRLVAASYDAGIPVDNS